MAHPPHLHQLLQTHMHVTARFKVRLVAAVATSSFVVLAAHAQMTVGVIASATGATAVVGIPQKNTAALLPKQIGSVGVDCIVYDDASDSTQSVALVKRLLSEE